MQTIETHLQPEAKIGTVGLFAFKLLNNTKWHKVKSEKRWKQSRISFKWGCGVFKLNSGNSDTALVIQTWGGLEREAAVKSLRQTW